MKDYFMLIVLTVFLILLAVYQPLHRAMMIWISARQCNQSVPGAERKSLE
jgi:hypothetical protein